MRESRELDLFAAMLEAHSGRVAIMPDGNFHMKPLVNAICAALGAGARP